MRNDLAEVGTGELRAPTVRLTVLCLGLLSASACPPDLEEARRAAAPDGRGRRELDAGSAPNGTTARLRLPIGPRPPGREPDSGEPLRTALARPAALGKRCQTIESDGPSANVWLRVYMTQEVHPEDAARALSTLAAYFRPLGLRFSLPEAPVRLAQAHLVARGAPAEALAPLGDFLSAHARAGQLDNQQPQPASERAFARRVNVVFVQELAPAGPQYFRRLSGLTLTDRLRREGDPLANLLGLNYPIDDTMLIALEAAQPSGAARTPHRTTRPLTIAHEFGHVLGLAHPPSDRARNLMGTGPHPCVPALTVAQKRKARHTLASWRN